MKKILQHKERQSCTLSEKEPIPKRRIRARKTNNKRDARSALNRPEQHRKLQYARSTHNTSGQHRKSLVSKMILTNNTLFHIFTRRQRIILLLLDEAIYHIVHRPEAHQSDLQTFIISYLASHSASNRSSHAFGTISSRRLEKNGCCKASYIIIIIIPSSTAALIRFAGLNVSIFSIKSAASAGTALEMHCKNGRSSTRFRLTNSRTSAFSIISKSYSQQITSLSLPPSACRRS